MARNFQSLGESGGDKGTKFLSIQNYIPVRKEEGCGQDRQEHNTGCWSCEFQEGEWRKEMKTLSDGEGVMGRDKGEQVVQARPGPSCTPSPEL